MYISVYKLVAVGCSNVCVHIVLTALHGLEFSIIRIVVTGPDDMHAWSGLILAAWSSLIWL